MEPPTRGTLDPLDVRIDRVLNKYMSVWLWSIVFGAATGVSLTFANYRVFGEWSRLGIVLVPLVAIGGLAALMSWYFLLQYLVMFLLPLFFSHATDYTENTDLQYRGAKLLRQAVRSLLLSLAAGIVAAIFQLVFSAIRVF